MLALRLKFQMFIAHFCFLAYSYQMIEFTAALLCDTQCEIKIGLFPLVNDNPESEIGIGCFFVNIYPLVVVIIIALTLLGKCKACVISTVTCVTTGLRRMRVMACIKYKRPHTVHLQEGANSKEHLSPSLCSSE